MRTKDFRLLRSGPLVTILTKRIILDEPYDLLLGRYDEPTDKIFFRWETSAKLNLLDSYIWGYLLNEKLPITEKVMRQSVSILESARINATSTAAEADDYHGLINEDRGFKLINTGTIDRYESLWGRSQLIDKGRRYLTPFLPTRSDVISDNRKDLYSSEKIILSKIALSTEAFYDNDGSYASINTNCFHSFSVGFHPKYVLAWLNSRLFQYTFECFFEGLKMQGGYLSYSSLYLSKMLIAQLTEQQQAPIIVLVDKILELKKSGGDTTELENQIDQAVYALYNLTPEEIKLVKGV